MFRFHTGRTAAILALLSTAALPQTVSAASYLDASKTSVKTAHVASLTDIAKENSGLTTRTLDWRQPNVDLFFDLPPAERTSSIVLTLSADPLSRVSANTPLMVQFNDGKAIPVVTNGKGFEARFPFDARLSRSKRNRIRISYPTPNGADCVTPAHGAWSIDLQNSTLSMSGWSKKRNMNLSEIADFLEQPALTPKTVGLIARGPNSTDMQALAAQAISLRTPEVPKFSVSQRNTDFNIVMVKRNRLLSVTNDPMVLNSKGPRFFVPSDRPKQLVFTADTDAEIIEMLGLFATHKLPNTRRTISSSGELFMQNRLSYDSRQVDGKTRLINIAGRAADGLSHAQTYKFNVDDPAAMGGELLLRLSTPETKLSDDSRLRVVLNGTTLGAAKLNKTRKSVAFDVQPGDLTSTSNILTLIPDVQATAGFSCPLNSEYVSAGYSVGYGSYINLKKTVQTPATELSQLTSSGGLFAKSESYISLPRQTRDYQAALRVLGRLAKSTGHGLISADYSRQPVSGADKHVLIIGPSEMVKGHLKGAPKALREALSGQSSTGDNLLQASYGQSASIGSDAAALQYAEALSAPRRIKNGGVAALYSGGKGQLTGVISSTPGSSFIKSSQELIQTKHWGALKGGVSRWTNNSVMMVQTAQSDAGIFKTKEKQSKRFPDLGIYAVDNLDLHLPEINWPEFNMPQVSFPQISWPKFKSANAAHVEKPVINDTPLNKETSRASIISKHAEVTPRIKPVFKSRVKNAENATSGLRGPFKIKLEAPKQAGTLEVFQRETRVKWNATKDWFKAKKKTFSKNVSEVKAFDKLAQSADRLQDRTKPAGQTIKTTLSDKLPGKGLVQIGDRTVSAYGLMLIMAFALILLLMSLASPKSRLGGRH